MTWASQRLTCEQIKNHVFFGGADWDSLRYITPPFVPALQSITDTSYFPTDEIVAPDQLPQLADTIGADKDLAFLGYIILCCSHIEAFADYDRPYRFTFKRFSGPS